MSRVVGLAVLALLALSLLSCTALAQAPSPAFVVSEPVAIRDETSQEGIVRVRSTVWRRTYEVPGDDAREIARNLDALRLSGGHGKYSAQTKWDLRWSMRYSDGATGCRLAAVTVEYYAVVTLPRLVDGATLAPNQLSRWEEFASALEAHEMGHVERGLAGASALQQALHGMNEQPNCGAVGTLVTQLGEQAKEAIRQADATFDAETEHGALQGATFP